jgi:transposase InsO family protein
MRETIVTRMEAMKSDSRIPYILQCRSLDLPYSSVMRWRYRIRDGKAAAEKPGPKPVEIPDIDGLLKQIQGLSHGRNRTHGAGALYQEVSDSISRRDFRNLVEMVRREAVRKCREDVTRITWHIPGMVWAFDDTEYMDPGFFSEIHLHSTRDLGSRYLFDPVSDFRKIAGETIAENLERLFRKYGPPLFLKRDNGSNLNHHAVDRLLREWMVIPVNSPPYYPRYNGSIEQAQHELKSQMMNQTITGRISCQVFFDRELPMKAFHKRRRKEVFDNIHYYAMHIANDEHLDLNFDAAWRCAVLIWLRTNGAISVKNNENCYPFFEPKFAHN